MDLYNMQKYKLHHKSALGEAMKMAAEGESLYPG